MSATGEQLALLGQEAAWDAASTWKDDWERAIRRLATSGIEFTADDVRRLAGPPTDHPNAAGGIFGRLSHEGLITLVGYEKSPRPSLHSHRVGVWKGAS